MPLLRRALPSRLRATPCCRSARPASPVQRHRAPASPCRASAPAAQVTYYPNRELEVPLNQKAIVSHVLEGRDLQPEVRDRLSAQDTIKALQADLAAEPERSEPGE